MAEDARTEWQPIKFSDTGEGGLYFEVIVRSSREKVGLLDSIPIDRITTLLSGVAQVIGNALETAKPKKASAELGVEFGLEEGKLVALIARGTGKANLKIKLEWDGPGAS